MGSKAEIIRPSAPQKTEAYVPENHHLVLRKNNLDKALGLSGGIPEFSPRQISTCHHEFAHAIVGESEGVPIKWISAVPNLNGKPPYLGVTLFEGRATPAMIAAGAAAAGDSGTGGDKAYLNAITGGRGESVWDIAVSSARAKLGNKNETLWNLASSFFLASGGQGGPDKMHLAFERARIEMELNNIPSDQDVNEFNIKGEESDSQINKDSRPSGYETAIIEKTDGIIEVIEHNLITGEIVTKNYFACCGGENQHSPNCKVFKKQSKESQEHQKESDQIMFDGNDPYHMKEIRTPPIDGKAENDTFNILSKPFDVYKRD